jgi:hypothetical protein
MYKTAIIPASTEKASPNFTGVGQWPVKESNSASGISIGIVIALVEIIGVSALFLALFK